MFDTQMVFLKFFFEKVDFEKKISRQQKIHGNLAGDKQIKRTEVNEGSDWEPDI